MLLLQTTLNSTAHHTNSIISPVSIINPRLQVGDYVLPQREESSTTQETKISLAEALQEVRLANLEEQDLLKKRVQKTTEPKNNQSIWFYQKP